MLISRLKGGLGNQLFIYSFIYTLADNLSTDFCFDIEDYTNKLGQKLEIDKLNLRFKICETKKLKKFRKISKFRFEEKIKNILGYKIFSNSVITEELFNKSFYDKFNIKNDYYLDGYWQNINFFLKNYSVLNNIFNYPDYNFSRKYFELKNRILNSKFPIAIHYRKGDYLNKTNINIYNTLEDDYYKKALNFFNKEINESEIYIFCNDRSWINNNIEFNKSVIISNSKISTIEEFKLMTLINNIIISNSTFSLWASLLNNYKEKKIIVPKRWFIDEDKNSKIFSNYYTNNMVTL